jgi:D-serine deaminase-like pyridoxal phosphate-dependent protein
MAAKARRSGVRFRPHFKTHQSAVVGGWFRDFDVNAITVSSVDMACYFARHGWNDITVAFSANIREIDRINDLATKVRLSLLVESSETVAALKKTLTTSVGVWIKIDVGSRRTGISWDDSDRVTELARAMRQSNPRDLPGDGAPTAESEEAFRIRRLHRCRTVGWRHALL